VLLMQTWREPLAPGEPEAVADVVAEVLGVDLVPVWNHRPTRGRFDVLSSCAVEEAEGREGGVRYDVRPRHRGQDPLLYLDLRSARRRVRAEAAGKDVLDLFAYTCGVGVTAAVGGAREVVDVDFAASALEIGAANARRNGVDHVRRPILGDCLPVVRSLAGLPVTPRRGGRLPPYPKQAPRRFDLVVLDPPTWATSAFGAVDLARDYPTVFKPAWLCVADGGAALVTNHLASVDVADWHAVLHRAAAKAGRPIRELEPILPDDDFPSPDDRPPLKMAWLRA
jgi:23S rRNA (cytosine1962-C5)-methyltransferase